MKHDFTKDLLDTVSKILNPVSEQSCEDDMKKSSKRKAKREDEEEMEEGYVSHAQRKAVWANRADDGKGHPDKKKKSVKEAKLDPVNSAELKGSHADRKDKDINNDGKADKTDEYLHNRRKAVKHAMAKKMKESIEESAEDEHFKKQSQKMQDAINSHLRRGKDYKTAVKHAQQHVKEVSEQIDEVSADDLDRIAKDLHSKNFKRDAKWFADQAKKKRESQQKNEEAEQIDEISGKTLVSYSDKVARYGPMKDVRTRQKHEKGIYTAYKKMKGKDVKVPARMEEVEQVEEGIKAYDKDNKLVGHYPDMKTAKKMKPDHKYVVSLTKGWGDGGKSMKSSYGKLAKEEVEQIDELSKSTLKSYINKATSDARTSAAKGGYQAGLDVGRSKEERKKSDGGYSHARTALKRSSGISKAVDKLTKEEQEFIDALNNDMFEEIENMEETQNALQKRAAANKKALDTGFMKLSNAEYEKEKKRLAKEEVEQVDEISQKLAHNYFNKSYKDYFKQDNKGMTKRRKGMDMAHLKIKGDDEFGGRKAKVPASGIKYGAESFEMTEEDDGWYTHSQIHGSKRSKKHPKGISAAEWKSGVRWDHRNNKRINVKEEAEQIDEARGRPRKENKDFTIHPKTKEKLMHNNPAHMKRIENLQRTGALPKPKTEAGQNIITQLRKASTSMTGGHKVNFTHGASTNVSANHAQRLLDKHADMKPNEKEDFQKKIGHSHAQMMKHL